eukprot:6315503-Alexandrium_andersonii.AAC.1
MLPEQGAFNRAGLTSIGFDKSYDEVGQSFNTNTGFLQALAYATRLRSRGLSWWATVCSTWVWVSRGSTGRSSMTPLGAWSTSKPVQEANEQVTRMCLIVLYLASKFCLFCLELGRPRGTAAKAQH